LKWINSRLGDMPTTPRQKLTGDVDGEFLAQDNLDRRFDPD